MKIVTDFYLDTHRYFWEEKLADDPLDFPPLRAVEKLASQHECHMFAHSSEYPTDKIINGMHYHVRRECDEWIPEIAKIKPDVILTNGWYGVSFNVAAAAPKAKKIFVFHCEPGLALTQSNLAPNWAAFDMFVSPLDLGANQIQNALPKANVTVIPFGINVDLCQQFSKPIAQKQSIACGANWSGHKGGPYVDSVLQLVQTHFNRVSGQNWGGFPKKQFISKLAESKLLFYPSSSEGTSRSLSEAAAAGVMPIVAAESESNVEHVRKIGGLAIRTGMYRSPTKESPTGVAFTVPALEMAEQLVHIADTTLEYKPNLDAFDARNTINRYVELILA